MRRSIVFALSVPALLAAGGALAHHGWGSYDAAKKFTITASVERLEWANPHVHIDLKHDNATWEIVLAPPFRMQTRGLTPAMIGKGVRVSVEGYPSTRSATEMRAERITVDGKTVELR
ncbi:DUF6152 family protein [Phreatobacter stygius]|nr:DUF6152 family protein [Phreatobacter stygius]